MLALPVYSKAQEKIIGVLQVINKLPERFSKMGAQDASMQANKPVFTKVDEDSSYLLVSQIAVSVENCNKLSKLLTIKEMTEGRKRQAGRGRTGHSTIADDAAVQKMVKGPSSASPGPSALQSADSDAAAVESFREANPFLPKPMPRECTAMIDKDGHMEVNKSHTHTHTHTHAHPCSPFPASSSCLFVVRLGSWKVLTATGLLSPSPSRLLLPCYCTPLCRFSTETCAIYSSAITAK
jgi:hypothetical protein